MLDSVKLLHSMGYVLYGSSGTADFYNEHGITVRVFSCCLYCDQNLHLFYFDVVSGDDVHIEIIGA